MTDFVTVSKTDPQFRPLLLGTFSSQKIAKPVKTLYVKSHQEQVTFKITESSQSSLVKALVHWYSLTRNIYLIFPILGGLSMMYGTYGSLNWKIVAVAFISLEFFLMALILYSDYHDYLNGIDRINEHNFKKPLLTGLIRPFQALQLAKIFLGLSILTALYLFAFRPLSLIFALVAFGFTFLFSSSIFGQKFKGFTSFMTFFLAGPLLICGLEYLLFGQCRWVSGITGFIYGLHAFKYDYCKQLRDIFYNSKAKIVTVGTTIGFEKSKRLYSLLSMSHLMGIGILSLYTQVPSLMLLLILGIFFEVYINKLLYDAASFLSANVSQALGLQKLHFSVENFMMISIFLMPLWT